MRPTSTQKRGSQRLGPEAAAGAPDKADEGVANRFLGRLPQRDRTKRSGAAPELKVGGNS